MTEKRELRGSLILAVLDEILHDKSIPWEMAELAARGISAKLRCTIAIINDKTTDSSHLTHEERMASVDKLIALGDMEDEVHGLWQRRCKDEVTAAEFQTALQDIVQWLEAWPAHLM